MLSPKKEIGAFWRQETDHLAAWLSSNFIAWHSPTTTDRERIELFLPHLIPADASPALALIAAVEHESNSSIPYLQATVDQAARSWLPAHGKYCFLELSYASSALGCEGFTELVLQYFRSLDEDVTLDDDPAGTMAEITGGVKRFSGAISRKDVYGIATEARKYSDFWRAIDGVTMARKLIAADRESWCDVLSFFSPDFQLAAHERLDNIDALGLLQSITLRRFWADLHLLHTHRSWIIEFFFAGKAFEIGEHIEPGPAADCWTVRIPGEEKTFDLALPNSTKLIGLDEKNRKGAEEAITALKKWFPPHPYTDALLTQNDDSLSGKKIVPMMRPQSSQS